MLRSDWRRGDPHPTPGAEACRLQGVALESVVSENVPLLLIDDDVELGEMMRECFLPEGFDLTAVVRGPAGLEAALNHSYALIILDVMLPGLDGLSLLRQLRRRSPVPVIMLTARTAEHDRIAGLDGGADDYLTKPFGPGELLARVRAVLRRAGRAAANSEELVFGDLCISPADRSVRRG